MKILNKSSDGLKRSYSVLISPKTLESEINRELMETAGKVKMDGFRHGKVPLNLVSRMYGVGIRAEAVKKAVKNAAAKLLEDEKLAVSFDYKTEIRKDDSSGIEFNMNFEIIPTIELKDLSEIVIKKRAVNLTEEQYLEPVNRIKKIHVKWTPLAKNAFIAENNQVSFDLTIKDGEKKLKSIKNYEIFVGDHRLVDDFSKNLIGLKIGESKKFSVNYPKDFSDKRFAGKEVIYSVVIKGANSHSEFELDDEFAQKIGMKDLQALKEWSRKIAEQQVKEISRDVMKRELLEKMSELYDFDVPQNMLSFELSEVIRQISEEAKKLGKEMSPKIYDECKKIALQRVRLGFIVAEIAKKENISVGPEEISNSIRTIAEQYPKNAKNVWEYYTRQENMGAIVGPIMEEKVVDFIFANFVKIKEEKCSYDDIIKLDEETFSFFDDSEKAEKKDKPSKKREIKSGDTIKSSSDEAVGGSIDNKKTNKKSSSIAAEASKSPKSRKKKAPAVE